MTKTKTRTILRAATLAAACTLAGFALAEPANPETAGQVLAGATGEPAATPAATEGTSEEAPADAAKPNWAAEQKPDAAAKPEGQEAKPNGAAAEPPAGGGTPAATAESAEKGSLKSPYPDFASVAEEGHKKYMAAGCNGCHGGGGGGGMGPPLTNEVWVYGKDDDTLFRLIALGSDGLQKQGFTRKGSENVVGPMPAHGTIVKSDDDLWKIIAWIRSKNPSSAGGSSASAEPADAPTPQ
jgi:mono/diheme cytochrome c family protein